jgi:hypothetical protein
VSIHHPPLSRQAGRRRINKNNCLDPAYIVNPADYQHPIFARYLSERITETLQQFVESKTLDMRRVSMRMYDYERNHPYTLETTVNDAFDLMIERERDFLMHYVRDYCTRHNLSQYIERISSCADMAVPEPLQCAVDAMNEIREAIEFLLCATAGQRHRRDCGNFPDD